MRVKLKVLSEIEEKIGLIIADKHTKGELLIKYCAGSIDMDKHGIDI
jgi:hypothetical protein